MTTLGENLPSERTQAEEEILQGLAENYLNATPLEHDKTHFVHHCRETDALHSRGDDFIDLTSRATIGRCYRGIGTIGPNDIIRRKKVDFA